MTRILNTATARTVRGHLANALLCGLALSVWAGCWAVHYTIIGLYVGSRWLALVAAPCVFAASRAAARAFGRWLRDKALPGAIDWASAILGGFFSWLERQSKLERQGQLWPTAWGKVKAAGRDAGELATGIAVVTATLTVLVWRGI